MGQDNLQNLHKWKNYEWLLEHIPILVYPRVSSHEESLSKTYDKGNITQVKAPIFELSSTFIRKSIALGTDIRPMLPEKVWRYIDEMNFYKKNR